MKSRHIIFIALLSVSLFGYDMGNGLKLSDSIKVGGYVSLNYENSKNTNSLSIDDIAIMAYGSLDTKSRYLVEIENAQPYNHDIKASNDRYEPSFKIERMMLEHKFSSALAVSIGKMPSPIGYWSQTPINVLRDTTSAPQTAEGVFPKLLTGVQLNGDIDNDGDYGYTVMLQHTKDIDPGYNNFELDRFYSGGIRATISDEQETKIFAGYSREVGTLTERQFVDIAYKYQKNNWLLISEAAYVKIFPTTTKETTSAGAFAHIRYKMSEKDYLIYRAEYYFDGLDGERTYSSTIGYNYRPIYPVSFKAEYQLYSIHSKSRFLCSASVLF